MIVDDHEEVRRMLRTIVADVADPIYECRDGREACDLYAARRPDWVFMDISMASMDGVTATRRIIGMYPDARILIVTQYGDRQLRSAAQHAGACGFVLKDNLLTVRQFIDSSGS